MNQKGSATIVILVILMAVLIVGGAYWYFYGLTERQVPISVNQNSTNTTPTSSSSQIPAWGQYDVAAPNALILVDSQGRRTGENPVTGTMYHEIPNTAYGEIGNPGHLVGELTFSNLPAGQYILYVLGGATGSYGLDIANNKGQQTFQGSIQKGAMVAFVQNYDPTNLTTSAFSTSSAASSTASITTAPPNNLPPPTVPQP